MSKIVPISLGFVKVFLIIDKQPILVDTGVQGKADQIISEIKKVGIDPEEISLIVVTHCHHDHVGSLAEIKKITGAKVVIQESESANLRAGESVPVIPNRFVGKMLVKMMPETSANPVEPEITFKDELDLRDFGVDGKVLHTPGHTPGSSSIWVGDHLIVGDSVSGPGLMGGFGASYPPFVADIDQLKESLRRMTELPIQKVHNSHGSTVDIDQVLKLVNK